MGIRPTENPDLSGFADGHEAADWAAGWLDALAQAGILHGVGGDLLALDREITRGSIVTLLNNAVAEYVHTSGRHRYRRRGRHPPGGRRRRHCPERPGGRGGDPGPKAVSPRPQRGRPPSPWRTPP